MVPLRILIVLLKLASDRGNSDSIIEIGPSENSNGIIEIGLCEYSDKIIKIGLSDNSDICPSDNFYSIIEIEAIRITLTLKNKSYVPGTVRCLTNRSKTNHHENETEIIRTYYWV